MIYLKVRGGLCNRIRTIDSLFILCKERKKDITIFWPMDIALNSKFESIFNIPEFENFNLKIYNCPPGFPDIYLPSYQNLLKNFLKGRKLDKHLKNVVNVLNKIPPENKMGEKFLDNHYNLIIQETQGSVEEMDNLFCERLENLVDKFLDKEENIYINSCYRLHPVIDNYKSFVPTQEIINNIKTTVGRFTNTFGLHIRRSDHEGSKTHSTLEKFITVMDNELEKDSNTTFFLSTDDESTKQNLIKTYGDIIIYNEISSFDRNSPEAVKDAVLDLYCLSNTKKIYGSHHSSFSQVAAKIGNIKEVTVK